MGGLGPSLVPWLVLACAASGVWAGKRPFNIHDDLLAYPQVRLKTCLSANWTLLLTLSSWTEIVPSHLPTGVYPRYPG